MPDEAVNVALADSTPAPENVTEKTNTQDAPAASFPAPGAQAEKSPPADDEFAQFQQTVKEAVDGKKADSTEETPPADEVAPKTDEQASDPKPAEKASDALSQESPKKWTDRPAWKELTELADSVSPHAGKQVRATLRGIFKQQDDLAAQLTSSKTLLDQAKPAQQVVSEMLQSVGGNRQGFDNMRHLIRSFDNDPAGAVPMLERLLTDARQRSGMILQSPELVTEAKTLDQQVADGTLTQEAANKRKSEMLELERSRAAQKRQTDQAKTDRQRQTQAMTQAKLKESVEAINTAEAAWVDGKLKGDPDFKAVQILQAAFARANSLEFFNQHNRLPTVKEAQELLEQSLKQAKDEAKKFRPAPKARPAVTTNGNGSSGNNRQQPTTDFEQFQADTQAAFERHKR